MNADEGQVRERTGLEFPAHLDLNRPMGTSGPWNTVPNWERMQNVQLPVYLCPSSPLSGTSKPRGNRLLF